MLISLVGAALCVFALFLPSRLGLVELLVLTVFPILVGSLVRVFGWILAGFLQPVGKME